VEGEEEGEKRERNSKDIKKQKRENVGKGVKEMIMNDKIKGDEEAGWTYMGGKGESVTYWGKRR